MRPIQALLSEEKASNLHLTPSPKNALLCIPNTFALEWYSLSPTSVFNYNSQALRSASIVRRTVALFSISIFVASESDFFSQPIDFISGTTTGRRGPNHRTSEKWKHTKKTCLDLFARQMNIKNNASHRFVDENGAMETKFRLYIFCVCVLFFEKFMRPTAVVCGSRRTHGIFHVEQWGPDENLAAT